MSDLLASTTQERGLNTLTCRYYGLASQLPRYLFQLADAQNPRHATGQGNDSRDHECQDKVSRPVHRESGECRHDYTGKVSHTVLHAGPPPSYTRARKSLRKGINAGATGTGADADDEKKEQVRMRTCQRATRYSDRGSGVANRHD